MPNREMLYSLALADGNRWEIAGVDEEAAAIVSQLGRAMRLPGRPGTVEPAPDGRPCRLLVQVDANASVKYDRIPLASENGGVVISILRASAFWGGPYINLTRLSLIMARQAQAGGGVLLHGALAERDGLGVILAAAGGTGKTTASHRLPAPWRSLCDDTTLVVRDPHGSYWAHPWPTWSRFLDGEPGGTWDVQSAVPLKGIFFLARAAEDRAERLGLGHSVSMLVECAGQASMVMALGLSPEELRAHHLERFNNLCALARITPAHRLHISLTGAFWREMERTLMGIPREKARETFRPNESEPTPRSAQ
ncbi:MAG: SynChlorMet cassette protein ScmC [Acidobacteriota bacterium]|nr:SynChlorMet cassette protein ScmC [Acidobacteriota bacterium]